MTSLKGRHIVVGVGGSIAATKAPHVVTLLVDAGAGVRVAMTEAAQHFVSSEQMQKASGHAAYTAIFEKDPDAEHGMAHLSLAAWAEYLLIVGASANLLARLAHGFADDIVTTVALATSAPLLVAPGMETLMWEHAATQSNVEVLMERDVHFIGPVSGRLASGKVGSGRMAEPEEIITALIALTSSPR